MEDKIEVGEFVRTTRGMAKVTNIDDLDNVAWTDKKDIFFGVTRESGYLDWHIYDDGTVLKHSKNIIDLIEEGDYVNGHLVKAVYLEGTTKYIKLDNSHSIENNFAGIRTYEQDIKEIVTKEQFESVSYKIEE